MNITSASTDTTLTLALEGRLDTMTSPELEERIRTELSNQELLVIDLSQLEYLSSAGLRVLLRAHKLMSGTKRMEVRGVQPVVQEVFDITGFTNVLNIT